MIEKMDTLIFESEIRQKINEIIDTVNSLSALSWAVKPGMPLNGTWMPGPIVDEDIDPIFLEVHTPPPIKADDITKVNDVYRKTNNLISELEDRLCR